MVHFLSTAANTYLLHVEHGNGYQWWSGAGSDLTYAGIGYAIWRKHNCYEPWCPWIGTHRSQLDGHIRCRGHHKKHKKNNPHYVDAKVQ